MTSRSTTWRPTVISRLASASPTPALEDTEGVDPAVLEAIQGEDFDMSGQTAMAMEITFGDVVQTTNMTMTLKLSVSPVR